MEYNDYKEALFYAASIFNERLGAEFSEDNLVLRCFQTENQQEVFEQFCKQYFPDRLEDRYTEDGYFDFHASAFVGTGDGADGILLRTDIARHPADLIGFGRIRLCRKDRSGVDLRHSPAVPARRNGRHGPGQDSRIPDAPLSGLPPPGRPA